MNIGRSRREPLRLSLLSLIDAATTGPVNPPKGRRRTRPRAALLRQHGIKLDSKARAELIAEHHADEALSKADIEKGDWKRRGQVYVEEFGKHAPVDKAIREWASVVTTRGEYYEIRKILTLNWDVFNDIALKKYDEGL